MIKVPCRGCITLAICKAYTSRFSGSDLIVAVGKLSEKCSILRDYINEWCLFSESVADRHKNTEKLLRFFKRGK